jgi:hypothetical protein
MTVFRIATPGALLAGALLLLAACQAPFPWERQQLSHPTLGDKDMANDRAECRERATTQVEKEVSRESPFLEAETRDQLTRMFDKHDAQVRRTYLSDECLRDKGYVPVIPEAQKN